MYKWNDYYYKLYLIDYVLNFFRINKSIAELNKFTKAYNDREKKSFVNVDSISNAKL